MRRHANIRIVRWYLRTGSIRETAERCGTTYTCVRNAVKASGVRHRKQGRPKNLDYVGRFLSLQVYPPKGTK
jgi:hypothetical protein